MVRKSLGLVLLVVFFVGIFSTQVFSAEEEIVPRGQYNLVDYERLSGKEIASFRNLPN